MASSRTQGTQCISCNSDTKRLHNLNSNFAIRNDLFNLIQKHILPNLTENFKFSDKIYMCEHCMSLLSKIQQFRKNAEINLSSITSISTVRKRVASTPPSELRYRVEIADQPNCRKKLFDYQDHSYNKENIQPKEQNQITVTNNRKFEWCDILDKQLTELSVPGATVLSNIDPMYISSKNIFSEASTEIREKCPILYAILDTAVQDKKSDEHSKMATISTIYAMILHSRNTRLSAIQRLYSSLAIRYHADNKLMTKLNRIHLMLTEDSKRNILKDFAGQIDTKLIEEIRKGREGKFNGDNCDLVVNTNDIRMNNQDKHYHFFASNFVLDRVDLTGLSPVRPAPQLIEILDTQYFIPNNDELNQYKESLKILLGREMLTLDGFKWMKSLLPTHIEHQIHEDMSKKSDIFLLPVSFNNETKYSDCIHIMDEYVEMISRWYSKADRGCELENLKVPVGGDQLTRVRLQGAKSLRAGSLTVADRLDQLDPVVCELFHTLQDFIEKMCKKFLKLENGRDAGTLASLKIWIQRVNVNGKVKGRFKAHEDFFLTCGRSYFTAYILKHFNMVNMEDNPRHPSIPDNINNFVNSQKLPIFNKVMDEIVSDIFIPFEMKDDTKEMMVKVTIQKNPPSIHTVKCNVQDDKVNINFQYGSTKVIICLNVMSVQNGCVIQIPEVTVPLKFEAVSTPLQQTDDLHNYVFNFMQWFFVILQFKDAVHEGDIFRINIILKQMIPFFYSHSVLSKYLTECIDYILKTEHSLSPRESLKVRAASFVNVKGRKGENKAADMHKENEVKLIKDLIKGLGANKTENSIQMVTKATSTLSAINQNFDDMLNSKQINSTHKTRSQLEDMTVMVSKLQELDVWSVKNNRVLQTKVERSPFKFDKSLFDRSVQSRIERLLRDIPEPVIQEDSSDEESD